MADRRGVRGVWPGTGATGWKVGIVLRHVSLKEDYLVKVPDDHTMYQGIVKVCRTVRPTILDEVGSAIACTRATASVARRFRTSHSDASGSDTEVSSDIGLAGLVVGDFVSSKSSTAAIWIDSDPADKSFIFNGRGGEIRTPDPLRPRNESSVIRSDTDTYYIAAYPMGYG
jgi:hypothetical protein